MEAESVISGESLVTNIAFIWLHSGVQFDVLFQIVISKKMIKVSHFKLLRNYNVMVYYDVIMM